MWWLWLKEGEGRGTKRERERSEGWKLKQKQSQARERGGKAEENSRNVVGTGRLQRDLTLRTQIQEVEKITLHDLILCSYKINSPNTATKGKSCYY